MKTDSVLTWIFLLFLIVQAGAQEAQPEEPDYGWKNQIVGNLNLTQASFSNWEQGGENTLAWQVALSTNFELDQKKYNWANSGKFTLGFAKIEGSEARKSADEINIESVVTRKVSKYLNPFAAVTAKTQFVSGFRYAEDDTKTKISKFLDPGYFTQSVGLGYKPNEIIKTRVGAMLKETITSDFPVPFTDDPATETIEKTRVEPGISSVTDFKRQFAENVLVASKLDIFSDLEAFERIDVLWENDVILKVAKFINVNVEFDLLYDKDVSDDRQIRQVLSVGFTYSFL